MDPLEALREELASLPVTAAYLFGSRDEGTATPRSDVDLAVLLDEGLDQGDRRAIRNKLSLRAEAIFDAEACDVVLIDEAPPGLAFEAIQGTLVVDRDPDRRVRLEARVQSAYHDRRFYEERWEARTLERFREEGFA